MNVDAAFLLRVLTAMQFDLCDSLGWRTDGEWAPLTLWVNVNDVFVWASSDTENITPENIGDLERAIADLRAAVPDPYEVIHAPALFAARLRKRRPQGPAYPENRALWALFDACGPANEVSESGRPRECVGG